jgi:hypothetical protein
MIKLKELNEIKGLLTRAQLLLATIIESQPIKNGRPPTPRYGSVAWSLYKVWDKLAKKGVFSAYEAKQIAKGDEKARYGVDSSYSAVLSQWAKDGHITLKSKGSGQMPSYYSISN